MNNYIFTLTFLFENCITQHKIRTYNETLSNN